MLSSITPLGQRGRGMSWARTVTGFWVGAMLAGAVVFGIAGGLGMLLEMERLNPWLSLVSIAAAAVLDMTGVRPLGPRRQVNEDWLGRYRDWVIGFGFGAQLGVGFVTIIPSWGTWVVLVLAATSGLPLAAFLGAAFGLGRSLLLLSARRVGSPSALATMMQKFNGAEPSARWIALAGYGVVLVTVGLYVT